MSRTLSIDALTAERFAPFGDVICAAGAPSVMINQGKCGRFNDLATLDFIGEGRAGISVFEGEHYELPLTLKMMERHPLGSQAFLPMSDVVYVVVVAPDLDGAPGTPHAFLARPQQGVNYHRNVWHAVLTPLYRKGIFAVVDRIGDGKNLEEHWFDEPYQIVAE